jgi:hypothetical protein
MGTKREGGWDGRKRIWIVMNETFLRSYRKLESNFRSITLKKNNKRLPFYYYPHTKINSSYSEKE